MVPIKADIIAQLHKDILALQGFKSPSVIHEVDVELGPIKAAFPSHTFPLGAVHEFCCMGPASDSAATGGFIAGIVASIMRSNGVGLWISSSRTLFPPALKAFGIEPDRIIYIDLQNDRDVLQAVEEALQCEGLAAVVGELQEMSFTASRRLQLAVEQSRVTGFILRQNPRHLNTTACVTRWKVTALPSEPEDNMPGVGFPKWNVELLKVRNGKPGSWQVEWVDGRFRHAFDITAMQQPQQKKTG